MPDGGFPYVDICTLNRWASPYGGSRFLTVTKINQVVS